MPVRIAKSASVELTLRKGVFFFWPPCSMNSSHFNSTQYPGTNLSAPCGLDGISAALSYSPLPAGFFAAGKSVNFTVTANSSMGIWSMSLQQPGSSAWLPIGPMVPQPGSSTGYAWVLELPGAYLQKVRETHLANHSSSLSHVQAHHSGLGNLYTCGIVLKPCGMM